MSQASVATTKKPFALKILVNGEWKESKSGEYHQSFNPSSGEVIAHVPYVSKEEVYEAVSAAQQAFPKWSNLPITERVKYLFKMKEAFDRHHVDYLIVGGVAATAHGAERLTADADTVVRRTTANLKATAAAI